MYEIAEIIAPPTFPTEEGEENPSTQNTQRAFLRLAVLTTNVQKRSSQAPAQAPQPLFLTSHFFHFPLPIETRSNPTPKNWQKGRINIVTLPHGMSGAKTQNEQ
jgi:hypothetical protein